MMGSQQQRVCRQLPTRAIALEAACRGGDLLAKANEFPNMGQSSREVDVFKERQRAKATGGSIGSSGAEQALIPEERSRQRHAAHPRQRIEHRMSAIEA
jgi:hypothetical protein